MSLIGQKVEVFLKDGAVVEGLFKACGDAAMTGTRVDTGAQKAKSQQQFLSFRSFILSLPYVKVVSAKFERIGKLAKDEIAISQADISHLTAVELETVQKNAFATDSSIAGTRRQNGAGLWNRELIKCDSMWVTGNNANDSDLAGLDQGRGGGGGGGPAWDQFANFKSVKKSQKGVKTFDETFESTYSTPLPQALSAQSIARAKKTAVSIEQQKTTNFHRAEERGQGVGGALDSEDRYSGVLTAGAGGLANRNADSDKASGKKAKEAPSLSVRVPKAVGNVSGTVGNGKTNDKGRSPRTPEAAAAAMNALGLDSAAPATDSDVQKGLEAFKKGQQQQSREAQIRSHIAFSRRRTKPIPTRKSGNNRKAGTGLVVSMIRGSDTIYEKVPPLKSKGAAAAAAKTPGKSSLKSSLKSKLKSKLKASSKEWVPSTMKASPAMPVPAMAPAHMMQGRMPFPRPGGGYPMAAYGAPYMPGNAAGGAAYGGMNGGMGIAPQMMGGAPLGPMNGGNMGAGSGMGIPVMYSGSGGPYVPGSAAPSQAHGGHPSQPPMNVRQHLQMSGMQNVHHRLYARPPPQSQSEAQNWMR